MLRCAVGEKVPDYRRQCAETRLPHSRKAGKIQRFPRGKAGIYLFGLQKTDDGSQMLKIPCSWNELRRLPVCYQHTQEEVLALQPDRRRKHGRLHGSVRLHLRQFR